MRNGFRRLQALYDMQHIGEKQKLYYETLPRIQVWCDEEKLLTENLMMIIFRL